MCGVTTHLCESKSKLLLYVPHGVLQLAHLVPSLLQLHVSRVQLLGELLYDRLTPVDHLLLVVEVCLDRLQVHLQHSALLLLLSLLSGTSHYLFIMGRSRYFCLPQGKDLIIVDRSLCYLPYGTGHYFV